MSKKTRNKKRDNAQKLAQSRAASRAWQRDRQEERDAAVERVLRRHRKLRTVEDLVAARERDGWRDTLRKAPRSLSNVADALTQATCEELPAFAALLRALASHRSTLLSSTTRINQSYLPKLRTVAKLHARYIRSLETWKPGTKNRHRQFRSLVRHLFAKYPVPHFMDEAWGDGRTYTVGVGGERLCWWFDIAEGKNIRKSKNLPIPLTKRMAHHFVQTPEDFGIDGAFRWAQVHALGGDERVTHGLMDTFLGRRIDLGAEEANRFYESVIRFFIANPMLDTQHYGPILDYLRNQKFVTQRGAAGPPQPNLSMKDRQADALLKQVQSWHARLGRLSKRRTPQQWDHHTIPDWDHIEGKKENQTRYGVIQLLSAKELQEEGRRLEHCVGSYAYSCASGRTSIWSMRKAQPGGLYTLMGTIEVSNQTRRVVQFRAKRNGLPSAKARDLLLMWAGDNGLEISRWIR